MTPKEALVASSGLTPNSNVGYTKWKRTQAARARLQRMTTEVKDYWPTFLLVNGLFFLFLGYYFYPETPSNLSVLAPIVIPPPSKPVPPAPPPPRPRPPLKRISDENWRVWLPRDYGWFDTGIAVLSGDDVGVFVGEHMAGTWITKLGDDVFYNQKSFGDTRDRYTSISPRHFQGFRCDWMDTLKLKVDDSPEQVLILNIHIHDYGENYNFHANDPKAALHVKQHGIMKKKAEQIRKTVAGD